jgi:glutaconate CoA-transferase, subunit A
MSMRVSMVYYGGFQIMMPMALTHEIIRQRRKTLTIFDASSDVGGLDLLIAAGCVKGDSSEPTVERG